MLSETYLTQTDARITILEHPAEIRGLRNRTSWAGYEIDAAHFTLSSGRSPVHIWNYARRGDQEGPGGATFDDTAVANEVCQLQLVINRARFLESATLFAPQTKIGTLEIRYSAAHGGQSGYTLYDGHVGQAAEEISTASGLFMSVMLLFQRAVPLGQNPETVTLDRSLLAQGIEAVNILPYHAEYSVDVGSDVPLERQYNPILARKDRKEHTGGKITVSTKVFPGINQAVAGNFDTVRDMEYVGAFVEAHNPNERQLFVWNPCTQAYMAIQRSSSAKQPIIDIDNDLRTGLLTEHAARLLGRAVLGREAIVSFDGHVLQSSDHITLLQDESSIGC